jgi:hypothetical protein
VAKNVEAGPTGEGDRRCIQRPPEELTEVAVLAETKDPLARSLQSAWMLSQNRDDERIEEYRPRLFVLRGRQVSEPLLKPK